MFDHVMYHAIWAMLSTELVSVFWYCITVAYFISYLDWQLYTRQWMQQWPKSDRFLLGMAEKTYYYTDWIFFYIKQLLFITLNIKVCMFYLFAYFKFFSEKILISYSRIPNVLLFKLLKNKGRHFTYGIVEFSAA